MITRGRLNGAVGCKATSGFNAKVQARGRRALASDSTVYLAARVVCTGAHLCIVNLYYISRRRWLAVGEKRAPRSFYQSLAGGTDSGDDSAGPGG